MYFVTQQNTKGLFIFLIQTVVIGLVLAVVTMFVMKKKDVKFFSSASFFFVFIVGFAQILFALFM